MQAQTHASRIIELPGMSDCLNGILCVIPLQLLAFHIAVLRGFDVSLISITNFFFFTDILAVLHVYTRWPQSSEGEGVRGRKHPYCLKLMLFKASYAKNLLKTFCSPCHSYSYALSVTPLTMHFAKKRLRNLSFNVK